MRINNYQAPSRENWNGRFALKHERFFQIVELIDLKSTTEILSRGHPAFALIGFSSDAGIKRNCGRPGAAKGPKEFRKIFGNLALPAQSLSFFDLGDIICCNDDVESSQIDLSLAVAWALNKNLIPIIIGGGHDLSFGGYLGSAKFISNNIGIINFDAHFDLRSLDPLGATSGTSFSQIAHWCNNNKRPFSYLVLGIQPAANTTSLFAAAHSFSANWLDARLLSSNPEQAKALLKQFLDSQSHIYLSICLDVFAHAIAPGVSAPQSLGLWPEHVLPLIDQILMSNKLICLDIAEYSPPLDAGDQTGKLCAAIVYEFLLKYLSPCLKSSLV